MQTSINVSEMTLNALSQHEIALNGIPSICSVSFPGHLIVQFPAENTVATLGNTLKIENTQELPSFTYVATDEKSVKSGDHVTLLITDLDVPSRRSDKRSEYCHYLLKNARVETNDGVSYFPVKGDVLVEYMGPAPPKGSGPHRYVIMLFKQPNGEIIEQDSKELQGDGEWGISDAGRIEAQKWLDNKELELLAVNFFYAENP